ncbi:unnamed protein product [Diabrotica balteata]|uniref:RING-type domain-containing protein n=1 Tax=Diabrotica balteata TaxID=107213 RepID=A0A9N9T5E1_DIABA|nr:unnamed protein product [Diabrotica balteata]
MPMQFTPLAFGVMLLVAVGTVAYTIWNNASRQNTYGNNGNNNYRDNFDYACGYDTKRDDDTTGDGQRRRKRNTPEQCSICLDVLKTKLRTLSCTHKFHEHCINVWINTQKTCPICREPISL